jgi:3',5'-cyclic AMP phosphodiesterase CpdA
MNTFRPFFFIHIADPQIGMLSQKHPCELDCALFRCGIAQLNRLNPAFVVNAGDFVQTPEDERLRFLFEEISAGLNNEIPQYLVAGNHDIGSPYTAEKMERYRRAFGKDRYAFTFNSCRFIVMNSSFLQFAEAAQDELQRQYVWLEEELDSSSEYVHTFAFLHTPFFLHDPTEESDGYTTIRNAQRNKHLDLFRGRVTAVLAGHRHRNYVAHHNGCEFIVTAAVGKPLGVDPSGFRIIKVYKDQIVSEYRSIADPPVLVDLQEA